MAGYLDNFITDRVRIIKEDKDPIHIYELLSKNFGESISSLKEKYKVTLDIVKSRVFIEGTSEVIYELFNFLTSRGVEMESVDMNKLRIDLDQFIKKIF